MNEYAEPSATRPAATKPTGPDGEPELTSNEARQGKPIHRMRFVLGIGMALVIIGFIVSYMISPT